MSDRGFLTLGINTDLDKVKYSYALALSIKQSDPSAEVCLVVDKNATDAVPKKYLHAFDYITELPFGNTAYKDGYHGANFWQMLHCSPFNETVYVDYDTIFNKVDCGLLWDTFSEHEVAIPCLARTYRNYHTNKFHSFEIEQEYNLPKLYNSLFYFKRDSKLAIDWFKMADPVFQNWRDAYSAVFKDKKPGTFNKNILANLVTHLLDVEADVAVAVDNYYDLDNKSQWMWNEDIPTDWTKMLNSWYTDDQQLIIENSIISNGIIHYRDENFLTKEIIDVIRTKANIDSK